MPKYAYKAMNKEGKEAFGIVESENQALAINDIRQVRELPALVASLTTATESWNAANRAAIDRGELSARQSPDAEFIVKASGIESRFVMDKAGVLDPDRLRPRLPLRGEDELGLQAEMALPAIAEALAGSDGLSTLSQGEEEGGRVSLRWILCHLVEEYARHLGHLDLLREAIDGRTGY